jgi:hypothetical protein
MAYCLSTLTKPAKNLLHLHNSTGRASKQAKSDMPEPVVVVLQAEAHRLAVFRVARPDTSGGRLLQRQQ